MHSPTSRALLLCLCLAPICPTPRLFAEQVIFSEIMFHPAGSPGVHRDREPHRHPVRHRELEIFHGIDYEFPSFNPGDPQAAFLKPFERILVSPVDEATLRAAYTIPTTPASSALHRQPQQRR